MLASMAEVLAFRKRLHPAIAGAFVDMIAEAQRGLSAGWTLEAVKAEVRRSTETTGTDPRKDAAVAMLAAAVLDFLDGKRAHDLVG